MPLTTPVNQPGSAGYSSVTLTVALQRLSLALNDTANTYWTTAELTLYIREALETWQSYTSWYRQRGTFTYALDVGVWQYLTLSGVTAVGSVTDTSLASVILYHLLESQLSGGLWAGTGQFALSDLTGAMQSRLNRFLSDSGAVLAAVYEQNITATAGLVKLPPSILDVRRAAWYSGGSFTHLWRASEFEANSFYPQWTGATGPQVYSQALTAPATLQLIPPPASTGDLDLLVVSTPATITLSGVALGVSDEFSWGVKWGALAELLSEDGEAKDPQRVEYCEQRYKECVELSRMFPSVLNATINGTPAFVNTVHDMDAFNPDWQNQPVSADPAIAAIGRNMIALTPPYSAGTPIGNRPTITLDIAGNMPVPVNGSDYLQVPDDLVPIVLGYAQHLAAFKMGGNEFASTMPLFANLVYEAANYNERLRQLDFYSALTKARALEDYSETPRLTAPGLKQNG